MTETTRTPSQRAEHIRDIITVFVLSITAVLTAWCGFEASKWGGEMSIAFSQASAARIEAGNYEGEARDARQFDLTVYAQWVIAHQAGNTELADYIEARFTPEFAVAFDAWVKAGMHVKSPLARPEYVPPGTLEAKKYNARADAKFTQALVYNQRGDNYSLLTVLFALVLFLTAMSQRSKATWSAWPLLGLAFVIAIVGIGVGLTFPILI